MHEAGLAQRILTIVRKAMAKSGESLGRAKAVVLEVGALAGIDQEALAFAFLALSSGTQEEGVRLEFLRVPSTGYCFSCEKTVMLDAPLCPVCQQACLVQEGPFSVREIIFEA